MATIRDVLRHLVHHAPGLSDERRAEMLQAVDEATGTPGYEPEPAKAEPEHTPEH